MDRGRLAVAVLVFTSFLSFEKILDKGRIGPVLKLEMIKEGLKSQRSRQGPNMGRKKGLKTSPVSSGTECVKCDWILAD